MTTIAAFHAHPDDEALLTGGTLARAAADGHRVVLVVATIGMKGPDPPGWVRFVRASTDEAAARLVAILREEKASVLLSYDTWCGSCAYSARSEITHTFDVRRFARRKQAAIAAHSTQVRGTCRLAPLMRVITRLPAPLFGLAFGREWYIDATHAPDRRARYAAAFTRF
ncbi:PIG-L deacetylase family protein [Amycolatopsis sp. WAC 01375]|uniref:PIG-L deacetylase family protein n=1 Tax=Amycolatopsis sp. WAC 01375 TaxID=2203194 RepID=UPI001F1729C5|nr:PIG-L family deacetylase [Amycolatopsis sp. WAC 01375]